MNRRDAHIPDEELLSAVDGELAEPRRSVVARHVAACLHCRERQEQFSQAMVEYLAAERRRSETVPDVEAAARVRLRAALEREARPAWWLPPVRGWAMAALSVLVAVGGLTLYWALRTEAEGPLPDARLTPGAVQALSREQVCALAPEDEGRLVPAEEARRVFAHYGISQPKPRAYEVDYLISPALGGASTLENLWPVPYSDGVWTSRVKDALEDHLRTRVCAGELDLVTAQRELAGNWIAAYQKRFRTRRPVAAHARFEKDSPWE